MSDIPSTSALPHDEQITHLVAKYREHLQQGKDIAIDDIVAKWPHLEPLLGSQLKKLRMIEFAKRAADKLPPMRRATLAAAPASSSETPTVALRTPDESSAIIRPPALEGTPLTAASQ